MDIWNTITIITIVFALYGLIRLVKDIENAYYNVKDYVTLKTNMLRKKSTADNKLVRNLPANAIKHAPQATAQKVDRRNKYQVNVEACEAYLASRGK
jgi:hypothetical protein